MRLGGTGVGKRIKHRYPFIWEMLLVPFLTRKAVVAVEIVVHFCRISVGMDHFKFVEDPGVKVIKLFYFGIADQ
jgi:hypothetical protein